MLERIGKWFFQKSHDSRCCCFHFGRCGSTLLGNMVGDHPDVDWAGEVFHALHENTVDAIELADPFQWLHGPIRNSKCKSFGFETKFQHLDSNGLDLTFDEYLTLLKSLNFDRFIILKRRNYLRQAVSVARGQLTKTWHVTQEMKRPVFAPFPMDPTKIGLGGSDRELVDCFEFLDEVYEKAEESFAQHKISCLNLCYEDDLEHEPQIGFHKVVGFLQLSPAEPMVSLQKLGVRPLAQAISNFDEIRQLLSGTKYGWMCDH